MLCLTKLTSKVSQLNLKHVHACLRSAACVLQAILQTSQRSSVWAASPWAVRCYHGGPRPTTCVVTPFNASRALPSCYHCRKTRARVRHCHSGAWQGCVGRRVKLRTLVERTSTKEDVPRFHGDNPKAPHGLWSGRCRGGASIR